jgi:mannose-6-phosphate isomerase-like protein (cupin superfamily)
VTSAYDVHQHLWPETVLRALEGRTTAPRALSGSVEVTLGAGESVTIAREAIHRVRHAGDAPAVSLHAYSPPLRRVGTYEVAEDGVLVRHPRPSETPLEAAA